MDILLLKALVMGVVEGLTEFLPVSSTGHLIIAGQLLNFNDEKGKIFEIVIQSGAVLAVMWEYRARFTAVAIGLGRDMHARRFVFNLLLAMLPASFLGLAFHTAITEHLFKPVPVALALIAGGIVILWAERREHVPPRLIAVEDMRWSDALKVGAAQALALVPGVSRSGATIIGGMLFGLSRQTATEFSFFLAVPTLLAAGAYDFWKSRALFSAGDVEVLAVGAVAAFVSAFACVRWLLRYIASHDFSPFGWYRIVFGLVVLATAYSGLVSW